ncbi:hypothetical protein BC941DRAFT_385582 [Chlamydoabsidia padenii]|nr:hypothetical protein BC941DRAFT_385582 [Chlamydoabsidia padenii]
MEQPTVPKSLLDRCKQIVRHPQFYWWCGHIAVVCNSLFYFTSVSSFHSDSVYYYRAYLGALVSYAIVSYKSIGLPKRWQLDTFRNENIQYLALAFYWYSYQPVTVTLVPYFVFSLFHAFGYIQSTIIPELFPTEPLVGQLCHTIKTYTDNYHELAMQMAAFTEVIVILPRLLLGVLLFRTSILALIVFGHFVRLRYYLSPYTQQAVSQSTLILDHYLLPPTNHPQVPSWLSKLYFNLRGILSRYGSATGSAPSTTGTN